MYSNVVIAYDGSEGAKAALARAVEIAGRDGASLTLVEAVSGKVPSPAPGGPPLAKPEKRAMAREDLREAIEHVDPDLLASGWVIGGPPGRTTTLRAHSASSRRASSTPGGQSSSR